MAKREEPVHLVTDVRVEEVGGTKWLPIRRVHYTEDGLEKTWDMIESSDAVAVLLNDTQRKEVVLVKQLRVPVFVDGKHWFGKRGVLLETCAGTVPRARARPVGSRGVAPCVAAGLMDKAGKDSLATACAEVREETGYAVRPEDLVSLGPVRGAAAVAGQRIYMYYAEVGDHACVGIGGGVEEEGENIRVVRLQYADVAKALEGPLRMETTPLTAYMLLWFASHKLGFAPSAKSRSSLLLALAASATLGGALGYFAPRLLGRSSL